MSCNSSGLSMLFIIIVVMSIYVAFFHGMHKHNNKIRIHQFIDAVIHDTPIREMFHYRLIAQTSSFVIEVLHDLKQILDNP